MPNFAAVFKIEIARLVRKELKTASDASKEKSSQSRREIVDLKRRVTSLEREVKQLSGPAPRQKKQSSEVKVKDRRFSASGLAAQRKRLGLTLVDAALLMQVSSQSVRKWEAGDARPRAAQLEAIAALREMNTSSANKKLAQLR